VIPAAAHPLPLRTERLLLRTARESDTADLLAYYALPEVVRYTPLEPLTAETVGARVTRLSAPKPPRGPGDSLYAVLDLDGTVVGDVLLRLTPGTPVGEDPPCFGEVGWMLHPSYVGRGLATEAAHALVGLAFTTYDLHRVWAQLDPRNTASARVCERLGMTLEGTTRRDFWSAGEWSDTARYGLLREEWTG
jgi:aminoglycoside 6'-N-acetyltransferase